MGRRNGRALLAQKASVDGIFYGFWVLTIVDDLREVGMWVLGAFVWSDLEKLDYLMNSLGNVAVIASPRNKLY